MKRPSVWFYVGVVAAAVWLDAVVSLVVALGVGLALALGARVAFARLPVLRHNGVPTGAGVVVTGASRGFGRRFALGLARSGYVVYATVRREEDGRALVDAWKQQQGNDAGVSTRGDVRPVLCDVVKREQVEEAARWVERDAERDGLDVVALVNNAGVQRLGPLEAVDEAYLRHGFDVNFFGALEVTRAFLPHLRRWQERRRAEAGRARVVFIGSAAGLVTIPYMAGYCATKHAVEALADGFRRELVHDGIKVTLVEPGSFATDIINEIPDTIKRLDDHTDGTSAQVRYRKAYGKFLTTVEGSAKSLPDPAPVVQVLEDVLLARFPPARVTVGLDAYGSVLLGNFVPDSLVDLVMRFIF